MAVEITNSQIEYLARYFNARTKMDFRFGKQENRDAISGAFARFDGRFRRSRRIFEGGFEQCKKQLS